MVIEYGHNIAALTLWKLEITIKIPSDQGTFQKLTSPPHT